MNLKAREAQRLVGRLAQRGYPRGVRREQQKIRLIYLSSRTRRAAKDGMAWLNGPVYAGAHAGARGTWSCTVGTGSFGSERLLAGRPRRTILTAPRWSIFVPIRIRLPLCLGDRTGQPEHILVFCSLWRPSSNFSDPPFECRAAGRGVFKLTRGVGTLVPATMRILNAWVSCRNATPRWQLATVIMTSCATTTSGAGHHIKKTL